MPYIAIVAGRDTAEQIVADHEDAARLREALEEIVRTLGPTSCGCDGLQAEVDAALEIARAALAPAGEGAGEG